MALSEDQKANITNRLRGGQSVRSLAKEYNTSENVVRTLKKKAGLPVGGGGGGEGGSASFEGPPPSTFQTQSDNAPVPTLSADVLGEVGSFAFWLWSLRFGPGWELDANERREVGSVTYEFLPNLPGAVVERLARVVKFIRPAQVMVKIIKRRFDAIAAYRAKQEGESRTTEAPAPERDLRAVPTPPRAAAPQEDARVAQTDGPDQRTIAIAQAIQAQNPGQTWDVSLVQAAQQRQQELKAERWQAQNGSEGAYSATSLLGR